MILLDLNMPKKDGREALRELKSDPELLRIPIVILTGSRSQEDIVRTYDLGANSFITKPVTFEALVDALKDARPVLDRDRVLATGMLAAPSMTRCQQPPRRRSAAPGPPSPGAGHAATR